MSPPPALASPAVRRPAGPGPLKVLAHDRPVGLAAPLAAAIAAMAAIISGTLYGLALVLEPAWQRAPLGLVALAPFLAAVVRTRPAVAAVLAAVWTTAATAAVAFWFPATLVRFFGLSGFEAVVGFFGLALVVNAPPYLVFAAWLAWRTRRGPVSPGVVGGGFLLAELARAAGPVPNPYALIGLSQVGAPTAQAAEWIGVFGLGGLAACTGALVAAAVTPALRGARPRRDLGLAAAALALAAGFGGVHLAADRAEPAGVRVAVVQPGHAPAREDGASRARIDAHLALSRRALAAEPDLLFWPEHAVAFYPREASAERAHFLSEAAALETDLVFGAPHYRNGSPEPEYYASLFLLRDGALAGRTDKRALVPFAEYDPLGGVLPFETARYRPGRSLRPLEARAARIGGFLCGEVLFPGVARALSQSGATLLANPSNDGWFTDETPARHQLLAARLRAVENRRAVVRATSDGYSAVVDASGRVLARSGRGTAEVLVADVATSTARTGHQRWPHAPAWAAGLAIACSTAAGLRRRGTEGGEP